MCHPGLSWTASLLFSALAPHEAFLFLFALKIFSHICLLICVHRAVHVDASEQLAGGSSLLLSHGSQRQNSSLQA